MDLTHNFLLSMPGLSSSYFDKTITYLFEHGDDGALGFIINRKTSLQIGDVFEQLDISCSATFNKSAPVFEGGPVEPQRGFLLYIPDSVDEASATTPPANDKLIETTRGCGVNLSGSTEILRAIANETGPSQYLLLLGHAGWHAGQLESEIAENSWLTCAADLEILFLDQPEAKFDRAARSLGIDFSLISTETGHA